MQIIVLNHIKLDSKVLTNNQMCRREVYSLLRHYVLLYLLSLLTYEVQPVTSSAKHDGFKLLWIRITVLFTNYYMRWSGAKRLVWIKKCCHICLDKNFYSLLTVRNGKKGPNQETGLGNSGLLEPLNDTKLILTD